MKCKTELEIAAEELRKSARKNPLDLLKSVSMSDLQIKEMSIGDCKRFVEVDGVYLKLMFTYDIFPGDVAVWHLSVSTRQGSIPHSILSKVLTAFFKNEEVMEMPSFLHGDNVRQFISRFINETNLGK